MRSTSSGIGSPMRTSLYATSRVPMNEVSFDESAVETENSADTRSRTRNQRPLSAGRFSLSSIRCLIQLTFTPLGHARRGRLEGVGRRVDVDLSVEHRGGEALGMEADFVDLASLGHHAVHQEIVVERASPSESGLAKRTLKMSMKLS